MVIYFYHITESEQIYIINAIFTYCFSVRLNEDIDHFELLNYDPHRTNSRTKRDTHSEEVNIQFHSHHRFVFFFSLTNHSLIISLVNKLSGVFNLLCSVIIVKIILCNNLRLFVILHNNLWLLHNLISWVFFFMVYLNSLYLNYK